MSSVVFFSRQSVINISEPKDAKMCVFFRPIFRMIFLLKGQYIKQRWNNNLHVISYDTDVFKITKPICHLFCRPAGFQSFILQMLIVTEWNNEIWATVQLFKDQQIQPQKSSIFVSKYSNWLAFLRCILQILTQTNSAIISGPQLAVNEQSLDVRNRTDKVWKKPVRFFATNV